MAAANLSDEALKRVSNTLWRAGSRAVSKNLTGARLRIVLVQILGQPGAKNLIERAHKMPSGPATGIEQNPMLST
jgi:hypothetical protein